MSEHVAGQHPPLAPVCRLDNIQQCVEVVLLADSGWTLSDLGLSDVANEALGLRAQEGDALDLLAGGRQTQSYIPNLEVNLLFADGSGEGLKFKAGRAFNSPAQLDGNMVAISNPTSHEGCRCAPK